MRRIGFVFAALFSLGVACGPDPNASLPGISPDDNGGSGGSGEEDARPDAPDNVTTTGGAGGSGPISGKGGSGTDASRDAFDGPRNNADGADARGGAGGAGGRRGTGGSTYVKEPCTPVADLSCANSSGGQMKTETFGPPKTPSYCFRTGDTMAHWGCASPSGWTLKVNGQSVSCNNGTLPAPVMGLFYFELTSSAGASQTNIWWDGTCKAPPYPPWPSPGGVDGGAVDSSL